MTRSGVALVQMPFTAVQRPSIGLSLLKAALGQRQIPCTVHYLNLEYYKRVPKRAYTLISAGVPTPHALAGEWIFAEALGGPRPDLDERYLKEVLGPYGFPESEFKRIWEMRAAVQPFLEDCLTLVNWADYAVVGFTSVFQQQAASLAMARLLKERFPHLFIIMGGANCEDRMGLAILRNFPWIDAVCNGEGDIAFPTFVQGLLENGSAPAVPGILLRTELPRLESIRQEFGRLPSAKVDEMDSLPFPDYDDYAAQWHGVEYEPEFPPQLLFESSRGCWWGAKSHCTFCGLNGGSLSYRSKSAARALDELAFLRERYSEVARQIAAVDNIIDMKYFRDLLPELKERRWELDLFYETKANLRKEQVQLMSECGITKIQPGIESLSTNVLRIMRKGVSALQNIQLLKWSRQYGVMVFWSILYGFPDEQAEDYAWSARLAPWLTHLDPPRGVFKIRLDRFSPYFEDPEGMGITRVRPYPGYRHVYRGVPESELFDLAYYFDYDYQKKRDTEGYTRDLREAVQQWQGAVSQSRLFYKDDGQRLTVWDFRPAALQPLAFLSGVERQALLACDAITSLSSLSKQLQASPDELSGILERLLKLGYMVQEGEHVLSLVLPGVGAGASASQVPHWVS